MKSTIEIRDIISESPVKIIEGIRVYKQREENDWFENEYSTKPEPWDYSKRGNELFRMRYSVEKVKKYNAHPEILLELGSSKGLMTELLIPFCSAVLASDISITALKNCKQRCEMAAEKNGIECQLEYFACSTPDLPFKDNSLDVVTVCDGLVGWWFSDEKKKLALEDINRVLKKGGIAILTDCLMRPEEKVAYKKMVESGPLTIKEMGYIYDKPWYKLESLFKKLKIDRMLGGILSNITIAGLLSRFGKLLGPSASLHIFVVLQKE